MRLERVPDDKPVTLYGSAWNRVVDFINMVEGANTNSLPQSQRLQGAFVQNEKGANIPPFHIVKIGDPVAKPGQFDTDAPYEYQNVFRGEPTDADTNCFGITSKGIPADIGAGNKGVGPLKVFGVCSAIVNVSDMGHEFAQPSATDGILESTATPTILKLIYSPATGENVCKVLWLGGESNDCIAVRAPIGGLPSGETADLEIFNQAGQTLSVENIWSTRVGDNPARILFVAKVRGIGSDDTYKPTAAECNEDA